jgi:hypothetical protein
MWVNGMWLGGISERQGGLYMANGMWLGDISERQGGLCVKKYRANGQNAGDNVGDMWRAIVRTAYRCPW